LSTDPLLVDLRPKPAPPELSAPAPGRKRPWDWCAVTDDLASADVHGELAKFVAYFNARYAWTPTQAIPACWARHGALVEELTTLMWSRWAAFSSGSASAEAAESWHRQSLPSFMGRLDAWMGGAAGAGECRAGSHKDLRGREATGQDKDENQ